TSDAANFYCGGHPPGVFAVSDSGKAPRPLSTPGPSYSEAARRARFEGTVRLNVMVGADGGVHEAVVIGSRDPTLDANAWAAVKTWKFEPATKDGKAVAVQLAIEASYKLR